MEPMTIEVRTSSGAEMRLTGNISTEMLRTILSSSTVNDWHNRTCDLLHPLYNTLRRHLMKSFKELSDVGHSIQDGVLRMDVIANYPLR